MKQLVMLLGLVLAGHAWAQPEWVRATVVKSDPARAKVTLKHEAIKAIRMEAMTMPFKVKDAGMLAQLKPGDKVRFTVALVDAEPIVTAIEVAR